MKIKKELIAIMDKRGHFIERFGNKDGTLAYSSSWFKDIDVALTVPEKYYEKEKEKYEHMAKMFGGQLVKIEAEYEVKTLDGEEPEIAEEVEDELERDFKEFLKAIGGLD